MKSIWTLALTAVLISACGGSGNGNSNNPTGSNQPDPQPQSEAYPCESESNLSRCRAEFKSLEVRDWYNLLNFYLDEPLEFQLSGTEETNAFECGAHMDQSAQRFLDSARYDLAQEHIFDIYELFVDPENCAHKSNLDALFREVLQEQ